MGKIKLETHNDIIIGLDHNLDFLKSNRHKDTERFICSVLDNSLFPCITRPTCITRSNATLINNILVTSSKHKSAVVLSNISDHCPSIMTLVCIKLHKRKPKKIRTQVRNKCKLNSIRQDLSNEILTGSDVNKDYQVLIKILMDTLCKHIPEKAISIPAKQYMCEPWLTKGFLNVAKRVINYMK